MPDFTEEQVTTQLRKMLQVSDPQGSLDLVSAESMHLLENTVINISISGVQSVMGSDPDMRREVNAGEAVMLSIATLAFGLGVECGIELHSTDEFTRKFDG